jgi:hypothetical protein
MGLNVIVFATIIKLSGLRSCPLFTNILLDSWIRWMSAALDTKKIQYYIQTKFFRPEKRYNRWGQMNLAQQLLFERFLMAPEN